MAIVSSGRKNLILGSRGSDLALWQAHFVKKQLEDLGFGVEIQVIVTKGDITHHLSFDKIEGKGFFTKEIEEALLDGRIDFAVHSFKDLPTESPAGLRIAALSYREMPNDALLIRKECVDRGKLLSLKEGARVGTSSARRKSQLQAFRPDISLLDLRGNVPTRIQKLRQGDYDAIMLASAGFTRLQLPLDDLEVVHLPVEQFIPAAAQGVMAIQIRENDSFTSDIIERLHNHQVAERVDIERELLAAFGGGCHMPLAIHASENEDVIRISQADHQDNFPLRISLKNSDFNRLGSSKIVDLFSHKSFPSTFVSRNESDCPWLSRLFEQHKVEAAFEALIGFEGIAFKLPEAIDWVFFGSAQAVHYFVNETTQNWLSSKKIAVYGTESNRYLAKKGFTADFVGDSHCPETVAQQLKPFIEGQKILFPQSNRSLRSIEHSVSLFSQTQSLLVYKNIPTGLQSKQDFECYIFTSPSNVDSYLEQRRFPSHARFVAIGKSTAERLKQAGAETVILSEKPNEWSLAEAWFSLSTYAYSN